MSQHEATRRKSLRSALAHRRLADEILDSLSGVQVQFNAAMDKLDADGAGAIPAVPAEATLATDAAITLTDDTGVGATRNTNTLDLDVDPAAANPGATVLVNVSGTAAAITIQVVPNDGTNNGATPVSISSENLSALINNGTFAGVTLVDASGLLDDQTAAGGDGTLLADGTNGDGTTATFAGGIAGIAGLDTDYEASLVISDVFEADDVGDDAQHRASLRKSLRSALAHRRLADELVDALEEMSVGFNALLVKLDAEAGTLASTDFVDELGLDVIDADGKGSDAQHRASLRKSLRSALAHKSLADEIIDAFAEVQASMNDSLAALDAGDVNGEHAGFKVSELDPDA